MTNERKLRSENENLIFQVTKRKNLTRFLLKKAKRFETIKRKKIER
jgi:hypothetical protein